MNPILSWLVKALIPTTWMKWIDGYKSAIALGGIILCVILPLFNVQVPDNLIKYFEILLGVGVVHKIEKVKGDVKTLKDDLSQE